MVYKEEILTYLDINGYFFPIYFKKTNFYSNNIYFKVYKNKVFVSYFSKIKLGRIINKLYEYVNNLIKKKKINLDFYYISNNYYIYKNILNEFYLLGEKIEVKNNLATINDLTYDMSKYTLETINNFFINNKELYFDLIKAKFLFYKEKMNINEDLKLSFRNMNTRYGTFSKRTFKVTLSYNLMSYSIEIISSVIVHELAHYYEFNHSKNFYNVVYKYFPFYDYLQNKLKKGVYK